LNLVERHWSTFATTAKLAYKSFIRFAIDVHRADDEAIE